VNFFEKIKQALKGYWGAWGKLIHKKPEVLNPFKDPAFNYFLMAHGKLLGEERASVM
jgi:hypothetical protein